MRDAEPMPVASHFGRLLRRYRLAAGLSQEALAERARMSPFAISALERGYRRKPQLKTLSLLAGALALDADQRTKFETAARATQRQRTAEVAVGPWSGASTPTAAPNNLPRQVNPLIGRHVDLAKIAPLMHEYPLVTLVGPGGVGKTRLALRVGETLLEPSTDGVWLVDLAAFDESASPVEKIASIFGLGDAQDRSLLEVVLKYLEHRRLVLILDSCEHLIEEAANVAEALVRHAPNLRILATSREPLRIAAERLYHVPTLEVPSSKTLTALESQRYGAITLFAERAKAAYADFTLTDTNVAVVREICRRLDGIPLAIELAAARASALSLTEIAKKLDQRFTLLTSGGRTSIPRQQTLRALIDWSYGLLPDHEKQLFRSLGVFSGDFSFDAVAAVRGQNTVDSPLDLLLSLVSKSLVHTETVSDKTRFRLLESVRAYAYEQLTTHRERKAAVLAHALAYLSLAERLESEWDGTPDVQWKADAEPELENWRTSLKWAFGPGGDINIGLRLIVALRPVWFTLAPGEGLAWVRAGLDACDDSQAPGIRGWLELSSAHLAMLAQRYGSAATSAQRALVEFSHLDEKRGSALARLFAGAARGMLGETKEAKSDLRAALDECNALGARRAVAAAFLYLAVLEVRNGDAELARRLFAEALTLFRKLGSSRPAAHVALNLAELEFKGGNPDEALRLANEALEGDRALNDRDSVAYDLCNIAAYEGALSRWESSISHAREALTLARERGMSGAATWTIQHLAAVAALRPISATVPAIEQRRRAARLLGFVDARLAEYELHRDFTERREHEQILVAVREALGAQADAVMAEGSTWSEADAYEESLMI